MLRNISSLYNLVWGTAFILSLICFCLKIKSINSSQRNTAFYLLAVFLYPLLTFSLGIIQGDYDSILSEQKFISAVRIVFAVPILFSIFLSSQRQHHKQKVFTIINTLTVLAALSLIYQHLFEKQIAWFASPLPREGMTRYSSLFGSLTVFGIFCGAGLFFLVTTVRSGVLCLLSCLIVILGAFLSLQKAAIANVGIFLFCLPLLKEITFKTLKRILIGLVFFCASVWWYFFDKTAKYLSSVLVPTETAVKMGQITIEGSDKDFSFIYSIFLRIIYLPEISIKYFGLEKLLFGVGPLGAAGILGFPEVPMSHNGLVDIFQVGGIPYFLIFVAGLYLLYRTSKRNKLNREIIGGWIILASIVLNCLLSGIMIFSPAGTMYFVAAVVMIIGEPDLNPEIKF